MVDHEDAIDRIMDAYDYRALLELLFSYDCLASRIVDITEIEDGEWEEEDTPLA